MINNFMNFELSTIFFFICRGTPHNSMVADDSLQVSSGIQEFEEGAQDVPPNLPMRDDQRSECKVGACNVFSLLY